MILYVSTQRETQEKRKSHNSGGLEKRLTHMPFTHAFTGSNPVSVTIMGA